MTCHNCKIEAIKAGKDRKGNQRFKCNQCKRRLQEERAALLGNMYLPEDKILLCLTLLLEGNSIRSIERITGVTKQTLLNLLILAGERCHEVMQKRIKNVPVKDVEADEI
jgi:transposase-like protein